MAVLEAAWGEVLDASDRVEATAAKALRRRIDADVEAFVTEYRRAMAKAPALRAWMDAGAQPENARALGKDLDRFLDAFPGDARLWGLRAQVHLRVGADTTRAWVANHRALALSPDDTSLRQEELLLLPLHLSPAEAERRLDAVYAELVRGDAASADVCFGFITAAMMLPRQRRDRKKLPRDGARRRERRPGDCRRAGRFDRSLFRALHLIARELLAGRTPGVDILYRCGLGVWAAGMASDADPLDALTEHRSALRYARAA